MRSVESQGETVLLPVQLGDVLRKERAYYNRFLTKRLPNPLVDAKQLVLFQNVPLADADALRGALGALECFCGKSSLARAYTAIHARR